MTDVPRTSTSALPEAAPSDRTPQHRGYRINFF